MYFIDHRIARRGNGFGLNRTKFTVNLRYRKIITSAKFHDDRTFFADFMIDQSRDIQYGYLCDW